MVNGIGWNMCTTTGQKLLQILLQKLKNCNRRELLQSEFACKIWALFFASNLANVSRTSHSRFAKTQLLVQKLDFCIKVSAGCW